MALFNPQDAPSAKLATLFCTIDGKRYAMINAKNLEVTASVDNADIPRLGSPIKGKKPNGLEIKLTFTIYKVTEMFDKLIEQYKNTGVMPLFEVQVANDDPATVIGRTEKIYRDCTIDGDVLLSMFDADGDVIEQEITAYALDFASNQRYSEPQYMM